MSAPLRLLCVDDDADIRAVTVMALALDRGIEARGASSGTEALALLAERQWWPDVLLLDVMMRGMSGPELLRELGGRADTADLPVIFMTARADHAAIAGYHALGALGVIVKPFDPLRLAGDVRALLRRRP